jgi:uncharacterized protein YlxP (DUF503 family)
MDAGYVAVLVIDLHFPEAGSLKAKRKDLQSIKSILHGRFGWAIAETAHHDLWQRSTLTAALTSSSLSHLAEATDTAERWLEARGAGGTGVRVDRIYASLEDLSALMSVERRGG